MRRVLVSLDCFAMLAMTLKAQAIVIASIAKQSSVKGAFGVLVSLMFLTLAHAAPNTRYLEYTPGYGDFGSTGLMQMPTGRMQKDGTINIGISSVTPYRRLYINMQALPWLEAGFRLTQITNRIEQSSIFFGKEQSFYDRGFDLKIRLLEETANRPQLAFGIRDLGGTNLFGSEYFVLDRRYYNWNFTGGVAWGNMGSRGHFKNPLTLLSDGFKERGGSNQAGTLSSGFFQGQNIGLFGGVEYLPPVEGLRLKLEYDGNSYQQEPLGNQFKTNTPLNVGVDYKPLNWLNLGVAFERGNSLMLRASVAQVFDRAANVPKFLDTPPVKPMPAPIARAIQHPVDLETLAAPCTGGTANLQIKRVQMGKTSDALHIDVSCKPSEQVFSEQLAKAIARVSVPPARTYDITLLQQGRVVAAATMPADTVRVATLWPVLVRDSARRQKQTDRQLASAVEAIKRDFAAQNVQLTALDIVGDEARVWLSQGIYRNIAKASGRAARVLDNHLPADIGGITLIWQENGLTVSRLQLSRRDVQHGTALQGGAEEAWYHSQLDAIDPGYTTTTQVVPDRYPDFSWSLGPAYRQLFGGPDQYYAYQVYALLGAKVEVLPNLLLSGGYSIDVYNTFDTLQLESNSQLPRVRSDLKNYLQQGASGLDSLQASYFADLGKDWYGRASAGIFEQMFAGAGGEVLYAPQQASWAVGGDFYWAKQRDFDGGFGFQPYETTTGHLTWYQDLPFYDLTTKISAGRYLAGDDGATLDLSRRFDNGIVVGVFATRTDVPAQRFGEGSFDKGFYIDIPLDVFFMRSSKSRRSFTFRPVTRDGGARLGTPYPLYPMVDAYKHDRWQQDWKEFYK